MTKAATPAPWPPARLPPVHQSEDDDDERRMAAAAFLPVRRVKPFSQPSMSLVARQQHNISKRKTVKSWVKSSLFANIFSSSRQPETSDEAEEQSRDKPAIDRPCASPPSSIDTYIVHRVNRPSRQERAVGAGGIVHQAGGAPHQQEESYTKQCTASRTSSGTCKVSKCVVGV